MNCPKCESELKEVKNGVFSCINCSNEEKKRMNKAPKKNIIIAIIVTTLLLLIGFVIVKYIKSFDNKSNEYSGKIIQQDGKKIDKILNMNFDEAVKYIEDNDFKIAPTEEDILEGIDPDVRWNLEMSTSYETVVTDDETLIGKIESYIITPIMEDRAIIGKSICLFVYDTEDGKWAQSNNPNKWVPLTGNPLKNDRFYRYVALAAGIEVLKEKLPNFSIDTAPDEFFKIISEDDKVLNTSLNTNAGNLNATVDLHESSRFIFGYGVSNYYLYVVIEVDGNKLKKLIDDSIIVPEKLSADSYLKLKELKEIDEEYKEKLIATTTVITEAQIRINVEEMESMSSVKSEFSKILNEELEKIEWKGKSFNSSLNFVPPKSNITDSDVKSIANSIEFGYTEHSVYKVLSSGNRVYLIEFESAYTGALPPFYLVEIDNTTKKLVKKVGPISANPYAGLSNPAYVLPIQAAFEQSW